VAYIFHFIFVIFQSRFGGVMIRVLASSGICCGLEPINILFWCFFTKNEWFRSKSKDWAWATCLSVDRCLGEL